VQAKKEDVEAELAGLEENHKLLEAAYEKLRHEFESEIVDHQETKVENKKLREQVDRKENDNAILKQEIKSSEASLEAMDSQTKKLNRIVKEKEKEIHNLNKDLTKTKIDLEATDKELKELKAKVSKDEKKSRKQDKIELMKNSGPNEKGGVWLFCRLLFGPNSGCRM
jgi:chromosome segregation ATPase